MLGQKCMLVIRYLTVWGVKPVVTPPTSWLEAQGYLVSCHVKQYFLAPSPTQVVEAQVHPS